MLGYVAGQLDSTQLGQDGGEAPRRVRLVVAAAAQEQRGQLVAPQFTHAAHVGAGSQIKRAQRIVNEPVGSTLTNNRFRTEAIHYLFDNPVHEQYV